MTLPRAAPRGGLRGHQAPRVLSRPPWVSEESGEEAIQLAESVGLVLDPWQQVIVRTALSERSDGSWAAPEVGFLVPRQNGKGGALEAIVLHGLFLVGDPLTLWTAHQTKTSAEAFLRIRSLVEGSADLSRHVRAVHQANGDEGISLSSGARLRFVARSKSSGRGFSPQRIIFDEAQELSSAAVAAMLFSVSAQASPQLLFAGTVPGPENNAEHWTSVRDRGRRGGSTRLAWLEWSPTGSDDPKRLIDLDSREVWAQSNPALGFRLTEETVAGEREQMLADPDMFARERVNRWPTASVWGGVIPGEWVEACQSAPVAVCEPVVLALETTFDRSTSTLVAVGRRESDGLPQVEVVASADGTAWCAQRIVQVAGRNPDVVALVIDGRAAAESLIPEIQEALDAAGVGFDVTVTSSSDMAQACGRFFDAMRGAQVVHTGDPLLLAALRGAIQRPIGDGAWAWSRNKGGPVVAPLVAATIALWKWRELAGDDYDIEDSLG